MGVIWRLGSVLVNLLALFLAAEFFSFIVNSHHGLSIFDVPIPSHLFPTLL